MDRASYLIFIIGGSSIQYPPVPLQAPSVIPITSPPGIGKSWLYTVDSRASILSQNTSSAAYDYSATAYIVNVSTSDQSYYYWQVMILSSLNLLFSSLALTVNNDIIHNTFS